MTSKLHPRSLHRDGYSFDELVLETPSLQAFIHEGKHGKKTIDFSDPGAVKALNQALLNYYYQCKYWDIPEDYLCPAVPGRADYIHYIADLLAEMNPSKKIPKGKKINLLDIGTGANLIYPIIAHQVYHWTVVGSEIDAHAIEQATILLAKNANLSHGISIRRQHHKHKIFEGILLDSDTFDACICNPPFYPSEKEAIKANQAKWQKLGSKKGATQHRNFGGQAQELWFPGGEVAFIAQMITESRLCGNQCLWFSALVSRKNHLPPLEKALKQVKAAWKIIEMAHGQKISRILAWTFLEKRQQQAWVKWKWGKL